MAQKYLEDGKIVEVVREIEDGFLVQDVHFNPGTDEQYLGDLIYFTDVIYEENPYIKNIGVKEQSAKN